MGSPSRPPLDHRGRTDNRPSAVTTVPDLTDHNGRDDQLEQGDNSHDVLASDLEGGARPGPVRLRHRHRPAART